MRRGARGTSARSQSAVHGHGEENEPFLGLDPNLPVVTLDGNKLQVTELFNAIILQATQIDSKYNRDIELAQEDMADIDIKPTPADDATAQFDSDFYPTGVPDATADLTGYAIYLKARQKAVDYNGMEHRERLLVYTSNTNKIRAMAMGQCDRGIQLLIKQSGEWKTHKGDLFWVLKKIREASHAHGHSSNILYAGLFEELLELFRTYQNQKSLNKFYQEFADAMNTLSNRDAILCINEAGKWEAKEDSSIMVTSKVAYKRGFDALMVELFMRRANPVDFTDLRLNIQRGADACSLVAPKTVNQVYKLMVRDLH
mmetsp:Transcript_5286/g.7834  ORF Transcript_5286/g.7834 Transcript_5286/m.7834 type:complete len:314 (+) Transcript_5286:2-943(+)